MKKETKRTLGDHEKELKIRDKKMQKNFEKERSEFIAEQLAKSRSKNKKTKKTSLQTIIKKGVRICTSCTKKKPIEDFYVYYNDIGQIIKIFPVCIICCRKNRRGSSIILIRERRRLCLEHYGKTQPNKLKCSSCKNRNYDSLVLFDPRCTNEKAIANSRTYKRLVDFNYPNIKHKLLCFNCAYILLASHK